MNNDESDMILIWYVCWLLELEISSSSRLDPIYIHAYTLHRTKLMDTYIERKERQVIMIIAYPSISLQKNRLYTVYLCIILHT